MLLDQSPLFRAVHYQYDNAGRIAAVSGVLAGTQTAYATLTTDVTAGTYAYAAHGPVGQMTLGNGVTETTQFNARLQPSQIAATGGSPAATMLQLGLSYCAGQVTYCTGNNGNLLMQSVQAPAGFSGTLTQTYTYDGVNRLSGGVEAAGPGAAAWTQNYVYDAAGNRALLAGNFGTSLNRQAQVAQLTGAVPYSSGNQWSGASYDPAGNATTQFAGGPQATYDAENRISSIADTSMRFNTVTMGKDGG